jgi:hypothetical protein
LQCRIYYIPIKYEFFHSFRTLKTLGLRDLASNSIFKFHNYDINIILRINPHYDDRRNFKSKSGLPFFLFRFRTLRFKTASANPRPAGRMRPFKLFSAALQLSLEIVLSVKNQQNHWNFRKIWPIMSLFFENAALFLIWVGRRWFKIFIPWRRFFGPKLLIDLINNLRLCLILGCFRNVFGTFYKGDCKNRS